MCNHILDVWMKLIWTRRNSCINIIYKIINEMEEQFIITPFNAIAISDRPININNQLIYGVLYNTSENVTLIFEYVRYLIANEQRMTPNLVKEMVSTHLFEYEDCIEVVAGEVDKDDPRIILSKALIDRYVNKLHAKKIESHE